MAITESLLVETGNEVFAIPIDYIQELYDFLFKCIDISQSVFNKKDIEDSSISDFVNTLDDQLQKLCFAKNQATRTELSHGAKKSNSEIKKSTDTIQPKISKTDKKAESIKVENSTLVKLLNLSSEMLIAKVMLTTLVDRLNDSVTETDITDLNEFESLLRDLNDVTDSINKHTTNINTTAINMRMVSIDNLFNMYLRPVREMAKQSGVEATLVFQGENTLLDKDIINHIFDPVLHILRNAVDHGIEKVEERIKQNKPPGGTVIFKAYQKTSQVYIEISDDGRGIDYTKLKTKIIDRGLATLEEVECMEKNQLAEYLFHHGFSTKDSVSMLSGRGVGLDVVKEKVELINGSVKVSSEFGKGMAVTLILPLTMAITESLLVETGNEVFAIPIDYIQEVERIEAESVFHDESAKEMCVIDEEALQLVRLNNLHL